MTGQLAPLRMGSRLSSATGAAWGRIGAFATCVEGRVYALVARHVAFAEGDGSVFQHDALVGTAVPPPPATCSGSARAPIAEAIAAVELADQQRPVIVEEAGINVTTFYEDPSQALDRRVRTLSDSDNFASGTVVWVGSRVKINFGDAVEIRYSGAIEVTFDGVGAEGLVRGDAGMPIVDIEGRLIGLAISGTHERCFIAPVAPFLEAHGLRLYRPSPPPAADEARVEHVKAGLRDVSANLAEWMQESRRTPGLFRRAADGEVQLVLEGAE